MSVWVLGEQHDEGYRVQERLITIAGDPDGETVVVTDGVEAGERVVTRGNEALDRSMSVRIGGPEDG